MSTHLYIKIRTTITWDANENGFLGIIISATVLVLMYKYILKILLVAFLG